MVVPRYSELEAILSAVVFFLTPPNETVNRQKNSIESETTKLEPEK